MKIVILNTSDSKGGAAIVSLRLMRALCAAGMDARMLVVDRRTDDERVAVAGTPEQLKWAFLRERLDIFVRNGLLRSELFKVSIANKYCSLCAFPSLGRGGRYRVHHLDKPGHDVTVIIGSVGKNGEETGVDHARHVVPDRDVPPFLWLRPLPRKLRKVPFRPFPPQPRPLSPDMEEETAALQPCGLTHRGRKQEASRPDTRK